MSNRTRPARAALLVVAATLGIVLLALDSVPHPRSAYAAPQDGVGAGQDGKPETESSQKESGQPAPATDRPADGTTPVPAIEEKTPPADPAPQLTQLPFGETLRYRGRVKKAGLTFEAGRANLRVLIDEDGNPNLEARAFGEKFGYTLNTRIVTTLDPRTLRPTLHLTTERGSERRTKKMVFLEEGADFVRLKHCKDEKCGDPTHLVKQAKMHGPIPWGTEEVHCTDTDCKHRAHYAWRTRLEHRYDGTYVDLLSAIYIARQAEFEPTADPLDIPIVSDTRRWKVRVRAQQRKTIEVAAGKFDAVQLVLEPLVDDEGEAKEKFEGLFGLNGAIKIWVERTTRRPVLIEGTLPFAFLDLHAQIELEKITVDEELAKAAAERFEERLAGIEKASAPETSKPGE